LTLAHCQHREGKAFEAWHGVKSGVFYLDLEMSMSTPKAMKLVCSSTGEMVCKVCGSVHFANIKPASNGNYYPGSWQCVYGCQMPDKVGSFFNTYRPDHYRRK